ncbi:hypothetical protein N5J43_08380 [Pseudomonas nicosulfuronedens]|uniref:hypothetical protein n=1 Tax=Pseudomonas nicosulfuronedens TaxID=2571105 RepID=UPI00244724B6|nr:hypothetical protein [Pseudomonas nicosulfuronedens]MDH1009987.1 hypothetical protein [Pseudomonas nicosulfuronedens]MDH1978963.1 hypothetical protein [Pseudomonas nicosulfuronedens]MDH2028358.1 hypothetical protein [Pseudomonas nicosulfuronedens]
MSIEEISRAVHEPLVIIESGVPVFAPGALDLLATWPFPNAALIFYLRAIDELFQAFKATGASPKLHEKMRAQAANAWRSDRPWST